MTDKTPLVPTPAPAVSTNNAQAAASTVPTPLLEGTFDGRNAFAQLIRDALATAARDGWRELLLVDASFEDWPLGERAVVDSLQAWSKTGRKFTIVAKRFDTLIAKHHRFVTWRGQWSHIVQAHGIAQADASELTSAIYSPNWVMRRLDTVRSKGIASSDPARRVMLREEINEWIGKSSPAFAATTLGL